MGLYEDAMKAAVANKVASKKRTSENLAAVINWIDTLETMTSPVGGSGGGSSSGGSGLFSGGSASSIRNASEGRGPSSGGIPPMKTWHWRDPIDNQRFSVTTAKGTKKSFKGLLRSLSSTGYDIDSIGGYNYRNVRGGNRLSEHAYGKAIDINPAQNPMSSNLVTNMPANTAALARLHGLVWGGTWKSKKDAMHFSTTGY